MTLIADGQDRMLQCETCSAETDIFNGDEFELMIRQAKAQGWKIELVGGEWIHTCPDCQAGSRLARAQRMFGGG